VRASAGLSSRKASPERIAAFEEAGRLISALQASERALWAVAFYGGLLLGELRALELKNVRLDAGEIRVEGNMDGTGVSPLAATLDQRLASRWLHLDLLISPLAQPVVQPH
jgi:site-specific recombinase XerC